MRSILQSVKKHKGEHVLLFLFIAVGFSILLYINLLTKNGEQQFVELSYSFLQGKLFLLPKSEYINDTVIFQEKYYWPLGPMPAVLIMPFVAMWGLAFQQGFAQFALIVINFFLLFLIAKKITKNSHSSLWLSFGYIFSSVFIGIATRPWAWQFAQVTATMFLLLALYEYFSKQRFLLIGLFIGCAIATRYSLVFSSIFFILGIFFSSINLKNKLKHMALLFFPITLCILCLLVYNYARFYNFFEQGYSLQNLTIPDLIANRAYALWSFAHFPSNLYYFFLAGPLPIFNPGTKILTYPYIKPDSWGMSVFFTTPMFLWLAKMPFKLKEVLFACITAIILAFFILGFYGIGFSQFGYRYSLDFYPFLFVALAYSVRKKFPNLLKVVIIGSFCFNYYLLSHDW